MKGPWRRAFSLEIARASAQGRLRTSVESLARVRGSARGPRARSDGDAQAQWLLRVAYAAPVAERARSTHPAKAVDAAVGPQRPEDGEGAALDQLARDERSGNGRE